MGGRVALAFGRYFDLAVGGIVELPSGSTVVEEWRVVDRWWTDSPNETRWRCVVLLDGERMDQRLDDDGVWREHHL